MVVIEIGAVPAANGDPGAGARPPFEELMEKAETVLLPSFTTYRKAPEGSMEIETGLAPTANGEPGTGVSVPEAILTKKAEIEFEFALAT